MIDRKDYYHIGKILKLHGFNGHFLLKTLAFLKPKLKKSEPVFLEIDGILVPFFVLDFSHSHGDAQILLLEDINSEILAREYLGCEVYMPLHQKQNVPQKEGDLNNLLGYKLLDQNNVEVGRVEEIIEIPQNNLFRVLAGKREYLLPANKKLILEVDKIKKEIYYDLPEGLLDI